MTVTYIDPAGKGTDDGAPRARRRGLTMAAAATFLVAVTLSLLVTRIGTVALILTGMASEAARFQARSAFSGAGFTTSESEQIVEHPVRRRIIMLLMLFGSAGVASVVATLVLSFVGAASLRQGLARVGVLLLGLGALLVLSRSSLVERSLSRVIERALRRFTHVDVRDYAGLLRLHGSWTVVELAVEEEDWIANRPLSELDLPHEGVLVLGIERADDRYVGAPQGSARLLPGDTVLLYGPEEILADIDVRKKDATGEAARKTAMATYRQWIGKQQAEERAAGASC
ncbi:MAG: TrkA C-terminal domain-containing protein [Actinomycetota bacterium]